MVEEKKEENEDVLPDTVSEPEPKIPDVELIVDGFGIMPPPPPPPPAVTTLETTAKGKKDKKDKKEKKEKVEPVEDVPVLCTDSSTNINIVRRYTWKTKNRMTVQVISYGATITTISVPDRKGVPDDVIAGFDTLEEYFQKGNPYFGATIGRYANIIKEATMIVRPSGRMYMLSGNKGHHHYHGGFVGFDKINWHSYVVGEKVIMSHVSERFHEGYPGALMAQVTFEVTCDNSIKIEMKCTTTEPTAVNMSNSQFFNLGGHHAGPTEMLSHIITINGDKYIVTDDNGIVTGEKKVVGGTPYDFRIPRLLKTMLVKMPRGGYNLNYCITRGVEQDIGFHARVLHPGSGRVLEVYSNQPGMQFYTGQDLPDPDKIIEISGAVVGGEEEDEEAKSKKKETNENTKSSPSSTYASEAMEEDGSEGKVSVGYVPLNGKSGKPYVRHGLFCVMPQNYPDAINNKNFPCPLLNPGEVYVHKIQYKFGILLGKYF